MDVGEVSSEMADKFQIVDYVFVSVEGSMP